MIFDYDGDKLVNTKKEILIYDKGEIIGKVIDNAGYPEDTCMCLSVITINDKQYDILRILDMEYGIVIPKHVANGIKDILNKECETSQQKKDILNRKFGRLIDDDVDNNKMEDRNEKRNINI